MIRTVIKPDSEFVSIKLPEKFIGQQVEVIAFTVEEATIADDRIETHFASQQSMAKDWLTTEEDAAWQDL